MTIPEDAWGRAVEAFRGAKRPVLLCHVGPDGDALGSVLGMGLALRKIGRDPLVSWGSEPLLVPKHYSFLPGQDLLVPPSAIPDSPELLAVFDTAALDRLGILEPKARAARKLLVIDHHASNDHFGSINLVEPTAAASAVVTFGLIQRLGIELDRDIGRCLYTGIVTDTGRLQYRNASREVFLIAERLLSLGIDHDEVARLVYDNHPFGYLKLVSLALERAELDEKAGLVWTWVMLEDVKRAGIEVEDTEALIDVVRTAEEAEVACVLKETPEGRFKVSMRSKGNVDVGALCEVFGGGGHAFAAGFTSQNSDPASIARDIASHLRV